ncbi:MAG: LytTR family DNA-binding domain-containing protein [Pseudomonadota bacterium]
MSIQALKSLTLKSDRADRAKAFAFFFGLPTLLAFLTATQPGYSNVFGLVGAFLYLAAIALVPWWIAEAFTRAVWWVARPLRPPLWVLCSLGITAGGVLVYPYVIAVTDVFVQFWPEAASSEVLVSPSMDAIGIFLQSLHAIAYWTLANYLFDRLLGFPRFRYPEKERAGLGTPTDETEESAGPRPKLLQHARRFYRLADILLVKAEEHYVRLYGANEEELASYRFGLAILDLVQEDGFRVHRSYWVRRTAVAAVKERSGRLELVMKGGQVVPVSRQYHGLVRQVFLKSDRKTCAS